MTANMGDEVTETEILEKVKDAKRIIAKNQRLAREYNRTIRETKREIKQLEKALRQLRRDARRKAVPPPTKTCKGGKYWPCPLKTRGDYCSMHDPNRPRCSFITTSGRKCEVYVVTGKDFCGKHMPKAAERCQAMPKPNLVCVRMAYEGEQYCGWHRRHPSSVWGDEEYLSFRSAIGDPK